MEHRPLFALDRVHYVGCSCGWRVPATASDADDAIAWHIALEEAAVHDVVLRAGRMTKKQRP